MRHGDNHDLWLNPNDPQFMVNSNDGGANVSLNGGESFSEQMNQPTAEFYRVTVDNRFPYRVYGGPAGQQHGVGGVAGRLRVSPVAGPPSTRSAAARAVTSPSIRATRTSSMPAATAARSAAWIPAHG